MKLSVKTVFVALFLSASSLVVNAQDAQFSSVKNKLENLLGLEITSIKAAPVNGLVEVITNRGLFYVSQDGQYFIQGRVFDLDNKMTNETEASLSTLRLDGIKQFEGSMIEFKAKNEKHQITVFTDITCGYCRKLHNEIDAYNDAGITVRYLAFPRAGLNSQPYEDMISVWCSDDQKAALTEAKNGNAVRANKCDEQQVAKQYQFGQQVGVTGTPAVVLSDGSLVPGYQPVGQMLRTLQGIGG